MKIELRRKQKRINIQVKQKDELQKKVDDLQVELDVYIGKRISEENKRKRKGRYDRDRERWPNWLI